jgi:(1->4)-alpha-D-glucan 1-alpha-D-glucosylmutase
LVHGTVGYEFLNLLGGIFVNAATEKACSNIYARFTGETLNYDELAYQCKRLIVTTSMASELAVLGHRLDRISERNRWSMDFTLASLTRALQEIVAGFGVYRTYITDGHVLQRDRHYVESAVAHAKRRNPDMNPSTFDFVRDLLLLRYRENADESEREAQRRFAARFQQLTGPIMAKAIEDTAFYRYNRLVSLNEVAGEPKRFGVSVAEFHQHNERQRARSSRSLLTTSTHDTKRSEDVRARIHVLSEVPGPWRSCIFRWRRWNKRLKADVEGEAAPSRNDEYLLYQTLVGIWPGLLLEGDALAHLVQHLQDYMLKAAREAKVNTSWLNPHEAYEAALRHFTAKLFDPPSRAFVEDFDRFASAASDHGMWNSLSQLVLKIVSPGVADLYQGTELWTYTLVDPDNRRAVDFALRQRLLAELQRRWGELTTSQRGPAGALTNGAASSETDDNSSNTPPFLKELVAQRRDGRIKLFVTWRGLALRREHWQTLIHGDYIPLEVTGPFAQHLVAVARHYQGRFIVAAAPRLTVGIGGFGGPPPLADAWQETALDLPSPLRGRKLHNVFTNSQLVASAGQPGLRAADLLRHFPVAILASSG